MNSNILDRYDITPDNRFIIDVNIPVPEELFEKYNENASFYKKDLNDFQRCKCHRRSRIFQTDDFRGFHSRLGAFANRVFTVCVQVMDPAIPDKDVPGLRKHRC